MTEATATRQSQMSQAEWEVRRQDTDDFIFCKSISFVLLRMIKPVIFK